MSPYEETYSAVSRRHTASTAVPDVELDDIVPTAAQLLVLL
jgi:hypothetical protein